VLDVAYIESTRDQFAAGRDDVGHDQVQATTGSWFRICDPGAD
jgi:hypothetical protein